MTTLTTLREQREGKRFARQHVNDTQHGAERIESRALADRLSGQIRGEVRFDDGSRALYATDGSNYRQVPIGVVIPRDVEDVVTTMELCRQFGAPVLSRGGGTSLAGQCCNVAVVMDFTKYVNQVLNIDPDRRLAIVRPGCVLDDLQAETRKHGLRFGPDPSTHRHCAIGGMLGNNSCGSHSLMSKNNGMGLRSSDNVAELEVLTYDGARFRVGPTPPDELQRIIAAGGRRGEIYAQMKQFMDKYAHEIRRRFPKLERRVSGYNLDDLLPENGFNVARALVGSEGTLVSILEATLHLVPEAKATVLLLLGYPDAYSAADHVMDILPFKPIALEGIDHLLIHFVNIKGAHASTAKLLPPGKGWLLAEFGADTAEEAADQARRCMDALKGKPGAPEMGLLEDKAQQEAMWDLREAGLGSTAFVDHLPDTWPGWEDSAVPVPRIGPYLRDLGRLFGQYGMRVSVYGHFGQGLVHCRIPFDLYTEQGIEQFKHFMDDASSLVVRYGGSLSGEHGDGQARAMYLAKMFGQHLVNAFAEFKRIWDPQWKMNPGKVVDPYGVAENLRLGPDYNPPQPQTHFQFPADNNTFSRAILRCVGVGKCRNHGGQTMCPSYMVTREEMHSTRGRARLLWEMMNGEMLQDGWRSEPVREALDLCLSCKGCKGDCPVNVDMATYKAEFLSHYYDGHLRPRNAYAFGWIHLWSRLASIAPTLANLVTQTPGLQALARLLAKVDHHRRIPPFAPRTFKSWFRQHQPKHPDGPRVVLFADTFNNYFHPDVSKAAVEVLEDAGFNVSVPMQDVCCGRPLYDYGFLDMAKRWLLDILSKLQPEIEAGVPFVVLEPSCWAVLADELTNMLPHDHDAQRLQKNVYMLGEFLKAKAPHYKPPKLHAQAILHRHCHHKSELRHLPNQEAEMLKEMGVDFQEPEDGCCGMAGAFGYEKGEHYDVAVKCGERVLLPEVRKAGDDTLIIADGFSCQEQISQCTDREGLHLAQVLQMALRQHDASLTAGRPEQIVVQERQAERRKARNRALLATAGMAAAGLLVWGLTLKRTSGLQERR